MLELPHHLIGQGYQSQALWDVIVELTEIESRAAGHSGESQAANIFENHLAQYTGSVQVSEFEVPVWTENHTEVTINPSNKRNIQTFSGSSEVVALSGSPSQQVTGSLFVPKGQDPHVLRDRDLDGKVVLVDSDPRFDNGWIHRMEKYIAAVDAGADGFIFQNHADGCLPPAGEIGYGSRPAPMPGVGVSKEVGVRMKRYYGDQPTVTIQTESTTKNGSSQNVAGVIGPGSNEKIVVGAHLDAHPGGEGAADNAAGCAVVVELARLLSQIQDRLDTQIQFIGFGAEEIGLCGSQKWVEQTDLSDVKCLLNIDSITGSETMHIGINSFTSVTTYFESTTDALYAPLSIDSTIVPHGDQWSVVKEGVPGIHIGAVSETRDRGWEHTKADTTDKIDIRNLRSIVIQIADVIVRLSAGDVGLEQKPPTEIREQLKEHYVYELKGRCQWAY